MNGTIKLKRVYEPAESNDGQRILIDRLWPRGLSREKAALDHWVKEIAPSTDLRKWFNHDPDKYPEFRTRYRQEIMQNPDACKELTNLLDGHDSTLLFGAHDAEHNQAVVVAEYLTEHGFTLVRN